MKKRVGLAYGASVLLGFIAFLLLMLKIAGPSTRWAAASVYALSWVLLGYAVRRHARARQRVGHGARRLKAVWNVWHQELIAAVALLGLGTVGVILMPPTDAPFLLVEDRLVEQRVEADLLRVQRATHGIQRQAKALVRSIEQTNPSDPHAAHRLRADWGSYLDYAIELDQLIDVHEHFYQINPVRLNDQRAASFLVAFLALAQQLESGLAVRRAVSHHPGKQTLFDEACAEEGYGANTYFALVQGLTRPDSLLRLEAGIGYLGFLLGRGHFRQGVAQELASLAKDTALGAVSQLGKNADALIDRPLSYLESKAFAAWFPLQKKVASGLGDLRVQQRPNFVDLSRLQKLKARLQPMDILLERRNWYVTNVGLPGFWPHAALYVGEAGQLDAQFDAALVHATTAYGSIAEFLERERPSTWQAYTRTDEHGDAMSVLEAISEGVVFQSLEHSGQADYLAVLRPRLNEPEKLEALLRAFSHHRKPYDFDFDFVTDNSLVCSELVYKSLEGVGGVHFELSLSGGRELLTPNQIAKKFDQERGRANAQLGFVAFLDGSEAQQTAFERDAAALATTWKRPKWDIAQP